MKSLHRFSDRAMVRVLSLLICFALSDGLSTRAWADTPGTFRTTGSPGPIARAKAVAVRLPNAKVLLLGGLDAAGNPLATAEIYDPATETFTAISPMLTPRGGDFTATVLPNGKVLIAGGRIAAIPLTTPDAEIFDPATNSFTSTGPLGIERSEHTATLLPNGRVLIAAGIGGTSFDTLASAEIFDPAANGGVGAFSPTGSLARERQAHTATPLPDGRVLFVGGFSGLQAAPLASAEIFDPGANGGAGAFTATGDMPAVRYAHSATLLPTGKVLIAAGKVGGFADANASDSALLFDPAANAGGGDFVATGSLATARTDHAAALLPSGKVLIAGGTDQDGNALSSAELFDPLADSGNGAFAGAGSLATARQLHNATLLGNGQVLISDGTGPGGAAVTSAELYCPEMPGTAETWAGVTDVLGTARAHHDAILLPDGSVHIQGGSGGGSIERYDPVAQTFSSVTLSGAAGGATGGRQTSVLLPNGLVFLAGGGDSIANAFLELYDPVAGVRNALKIQTVAPQLTTVNRLAGSRLFHTVTRLGNGSVLIAGGFTTAEGVLLADLLTPVVGPCDLQVDATCATLTRIGDQLGGTAVMAEHRQRHTATLLPNGKVLFAGGLNPSNVATRSAELFDPSTIQFVPGTPPPPIGTGLPDKFIADFTLTGSLTTARLHHTATLLPNGKVLVVGGQTAASLTGGAVLASAELYDPEAGTWSAAGSMQAARTNHTATLLPNGTVLVAGGVDATTNPIESSELYDPGGNTWSTTGDLGAARREHTASVLPNGQVLVLGGLGAGGTALDSAELYSTAICEDDQDPPSGTVVIAGGAMFTTTAAVDLTLTCDDGTGSGCAEMQVAVDGVADTESFENFVPNKAVTLPAGDGTKTVAVVFRDGAGNDSAPATDNIILDTLPPSQPAVPDLAAGSDTGTSATDNFTMATTLEFGGTAEPGSTVRLLEGGTLRGTAVADSVGVWSMTNVVLPEGVHALMVTATDPAGNPSAPSGELTVTVDVTGPLFTTVPGNIAVAKQNANGTPASDPAIAAFLGGATVTDNLDASPGVTTNAPGTFGLGTTQVIFTALDAAGNTSTRQATVTVGDPVTTSFDPRVLHVRGFPNFDIAVLGGNPVFSQSTDAARDVTPALIVGVTYTVRGKTSAADTSPAPLMNFMVNGQCDLTVAP